MATIVNKKSATRNIGRTDPWITETIDQSKSMAMAIAEMWESANTTRSEREVLKSPPYGYILAGRSYVTK